MIELRSLIKSYGGMLAVDNITATIAPGIVTGFLGPNGAGKSTTMRMIVGLDRPTSGQALVNGCDVRANRRPLTEVGTLLDGGVAHPRRSARNHLLALAQSNGLQAARVGEVLEMVGLSNVGLRKVGGFSMGMRQRLGVAAALVGDPAVLLLDEPVNGLDLDGVLWLRDLLRYLAGQGRTVLLSSHLMSEMAMVAGHVIVLGRGRVLADQPIDALIASAGHSSVRVRSPRLDDIRALLNGPGIVLAGTSDGALDVKGLPAEAIGDLAAAHGVALHELSPVRASLEDAYLQLTRDSLEYRVAGSTSAATSKAITTESNR